MLNSYENLSNSIFYTDDFYEKNFRRWVHIGKTIFTSTLAFIVFLKFILETRI